MTEKELCDKLVELDKSRTTEVGMTKRTEFWLYIDEDFLAHYFSEDGLSPIHKLSACGHRSRMKPHTVKTCITETRMCAECREWLIGRERVGMITEYQLGTKVQCHLVDNKPGTIKERQRDGFYTVNTESGDYIVYKDDMSVWDPCVACEHGQSSIVTRMELELCRALGFDKPTPWSTLLTYARNLARWKVPVSR